LPQRRGRAAGLLRDVVAPTQTLDPRAAAAHRPRCRRCRALDVRLIQLDPKTSRGDVRARARAASPRAPRRAVPTCAYVRKRFLDHWRLEAAPAAGRVPTTNCRAPGAKGDTELAATRAQLTRRSGACPTRFRGGVGVAIDRRRALYKEGIGTMRIPHRDVMSRLTATAPRLALQLT